MKKCANVIILLILLSCGNKNANNYTFKDFENNFINNLWKTYPSWATSVGLHDYDTVLIIPNENARQQELNFCKAYLDSLTLYNDANLSTDDLTDKALIQQFLESAIWNINIFKSHEWNPSGYNLGGSVSDILNNKQATLNTKANNTNVYLKNALAFYKAAQQNIKLVTEEHADLAIAQLNGTMDYFNTGVKDSLLKAKIDTLNFSNAKQATTNYINFIIHLKDSMVQNKIAFKNFRIGNDLFKKKFELDIQAESSADEIYNKALKRKDVLHTKMYEVAKKWWANNKINIPMPTDKIILIKTCINEIAKTHISRDSFQLEIERQIPILTNFVAKKDLIYLDPSKPLVVRKEPAWMAGVAGASISAPGPFDKNGNTYYNVGSLAAYSPEEAESFLREYNKYTLQILNIHEAIPGHYAQLVYSNQSPSLIKALFGNGAMIEGWAVYTELMMMEEGWDKNTEINGIIQENEMWLMYYKWHLRVVCNTILDYSIHVKNWDKPAALNLLMNEAFQEKSEAEGKWKRATLTQVQLCSYYTGFSEIYDLRTALKEKQGNSFNLKKFHESILKFGSAPVKFIKKELLKNG